MNLELLLEILLDDIWRIISFVHLPNRPPILPTPVQLFVESVFLVYLFNHAVYNLLGVIHRLYRDIERIDCLFNHLPEIPPKLRPYDKKWLKRLLAIQIVLTIVGILPWKYLRHGNIYFLLRGYESVYSRSHVQARTTIRYLAKPHKMQTMCDVGFPILMCVAVTRSTIPSPLGLLCLIIQLLKIEMLTCQVAVHTHGAIPHADDLNVGNLSYFFGDCMQIVDTCRWLVPGSQCLGLVFFLWQVTDQWLYRKQVLALGNVAAVALERLVQDDIAPEGNVIGGQAGENQAVNEGQVVEGNQARNEDQIGEGLGLDGHPVAGEEPGVVENQAAAQN